MEPVAAMVPAESRMAAAVEGTAEVLARKSSVLLAASGNENDVVAWKSPFCLINDVSFLK
ncbi:hypothetical protein NST62_07285 [Ureibacillus sp. FSL K6-8385]|uniref:hypothetical protein n=1 Tax=Ureibacillus TaxID=160795 RepID=UPI0015EF314E|nr:hypothetical protein [Ureibacillus terrenus]MED3661545.1 hypothetical protein [Ureibacillus terrenus]MED3764013.1 hypothetical protein [Ureibacillus terrenus]